MNLVAKEYVACRYDDDGALVLCEFAGAADELRQAFLVNPYDINGMKAALMRGLPGRPTRPDPPDEGDAQDLAAADVAAWAEAYLEAMEEVRPAHGKHLRPAHRT